MTAVVHWRHGARLPRRDPNPPIQVHRHDPDTFVLRQSKSVHYEGPFLYLLRGSERALLVDTGATGDPGLFPLRNTVDRLLGKDFPLVVGHSHAHGDHVAGDGQFADRPNTTVLGTDVAAVRSFFGIADWPDEVVGFDLGGRVLEVLGCPGHQASSIAIFDPRTGFLLTGDTVYPGRLSVPDMPAFVASLRRLVAFAESRPVRQILGGHVEMTRTPGRDYPLGTRYQPEEAALPMTPGQLAAVRDAAVAVADRPGVHRFPDFIVYNGPCTGAVARQALRGRLRNWWNAAVGLLTRPG